MAHPTDLGLLKGTVGLTYLRSQQAARRLPYFDQAICPEQFYTRCIDPPIVARRSILSDQPLFDPPVARLGGFPLVERRVRGHPDQSVSPYTSIPSALWNG